MVNTKISVILQTIFVSVVIISSMSSPALAGAIIEIDVFPNSEATLELQFGQSIIPINLVGETIVEVLIDPSDGRVPSPGLGPGGTDTVDIEMVALSLTSVEPVFLIDSFFDVFVELSTDPTKPTLGQIIEGANPNPGILDLPPFTPFSAPADSFFDVFFVIDIPGLGQFHNEDAFRVQGEINHKPPIDPDDVYRHTAPVELFDENGDPTGLFIVGGEHVPSPPPRVVGGEFLPIDSTALLLAGLQSSAIWMLPVLAGAAGATAFYLRTRKN